MASAEPNPKRDRAEATLRNRWERLGFENLTAPEQQYIALYWLVGVVMNGGFHQYFFNSSGDLAPLAIEGLKAVGATESLGILERALAIFPPGEYSTNQELRWNGLKTISDDVEAEIAAFDDVSDAFQSCSEDVDGLALDSLAVLYTTNGVWNADSPDINSAEKNSLQPGNSESNPRGSG